MLPITMNSKKRILVTGGAGFIGSHLCSRLLSLGHAVICMDNLFCGSMDNIRCLLPSPDFSFINHDVTQPYSIFVDEIYNLACPASPKQYQKDPVFTFKTNILGALHALELANKCNAKILLSSTSEVYGDARISPQSENYWGNVNPNGLRSCYDEGKRGAEALFFDFHRQYNTRIKVARLFNCYGPSMQVDDGRVICTFITQAILNKPITVFGDGLQTRSFCYVDDVIDALVLLMESGDEVLGPINIGNPEELTIRELAQKVIVLIGSSSQIEYLPRPSDDPRRRKPDITKAQGLLHWKPSITIDTGLLRTISSMR